MNAQEALTTVLSDAQTQSDRSRALAMLDSGWQTIEYLAMVSSSFIFSTVNKALFVLS